MREERDSLSPLGIGCQKSRDKLSTSVSLYLEEEELHRKPMESDSDESRVERTVLAYGIGLTIGVSIFIVVVSYFHRRHNYPVVSSRPSPEADMELGLAETTLKTFPNLRYSQFKLHNKGDFCCSICLADYTGADMLRLSPECGHIFHNKCVDPWLRIRPTCPICRDAAGTCFSIRTGTVTIPETSR